MALLLHTSCLVTGMLSCLDMMPYMRLSQNMLMLLAAEKGFHYLS